MKKTKQKSKKKTENIKRGGKERVKKQKWKSKKDREGENEGFKKK